jgi:type I restriction enzyme S subunit
MAQIRDLKTGIKHKNTPIGKIPVDWEAVRLEDVCNIIGGSTPSTSKKEFWGGDIPFATPTDITNLPGREISDTKQKITSEGLSSCGTHLLPVGSILLTSRATIGACAINTKPMATNQGFASLVCSEKAYNWFVFYKIISMQDELQRLGSGSTFKEVSKNNIRSLLLPLPPLPEQKRIAEILTTVDEAIEKTAQIIEKTKEVKKGLMQKLLTRGIGHKKIKRTEIGEIPGEWKIEKIANLAKENKGSIKIGPFGSQLKKAEMVDSGIRVYGQENVYRKNFNTGEYFITSEKFQKLKTVEIFPGDVLITMMGTIGDCCVVPSDIEKGIMDSHLMRIQAEKTINPYYLARLIRESLIVRKQIVEMSQGGIMGGLNLSIVKEIKIPVPSLEEQTQIENIMTRVDIKIENEQTYKSELEQIKKGLMQVLLTGKIRVAV